LVEGRFVECIQKAEGVMRSALLIVAILLGGCVAAPQTRDELKTTAVAHPSLSVVGSYTSNRRFEDVAANLDRKWQECYSVRRSTTRIETSGARASYSDTYRPQSRRVSNSLVEMTLQMTTQGMTMLTKVPSGGEYIVALDLERLPGNKTKLTWHSIRGWTKSWERNKQWSDGKDVACDA
jgi:hypothetical protein